MRPVNLIPADERRGDRPALRTGPFPYVVLGALGLVLIGVVVLSMTSKQISDRKDEVAQLQQQEQQVAAQAQSLQAYADFRAVQQTRSETVSSLAQSRFDWQRVMNELARVIPSDVWLIQMSGTVNPTVSIENAPDVGIRGTVAGPALSLVGCAVSQDAVAGFVSALQEIDGVTRVGVDESAKEDTDVNAASSASSSDSASASSTECRTRDFIFQFKIVAAFDAVPTPTGASTSPSVPSSLAPSALASQATSTASTGG
jgi:Tfp pilus assembly protein PilN